LYTEKKIQWLWGVTALFMDEQDFDLLAAALRANMADLRSWMAVLAAKLTDALPGYVTVHHSGLLGRGPVESIAADLGTQRFILRMERDHPHAERAHIVRGIVLKTEALPLDQWLAELVAALAALAETSAAEHAAVMRLLQ
jgi:hypothetical protein